MRYFIGWLTVEGELINFSVFTARERGRETAHSPWWDLRSGTLGPGALWLAFPRKGKARRVTALLVRWWWRRVRHGSARIGWCSSRCRRGRVSPLDSQRLRERQRHLLSLVTARIEAPLHLRQCSEPPERTGKGLSFESFTRYNHTAFHGGKARRETALSLGLRVPTSHSISFPQLGAPLTTL